MFNTLRKYQTQDKNEKSYIPIIIFYTLLKLEISFNVGKIRLENERKKINVGMNTRKKITQLDYTWINKQLATVSLQY